MTNRIRGKKRTQIIENWLKGVEDPDVEVKPTKNEGRYIVKAKNKEEPVKSASQTLDGQRCCPRVSKADVCPEGAKEETKAEPVKEETEAEPVKEEIKEQPIQSNIECLNVKKESVKEESDEYTYEYEYEEEQPDINLSIQMEILNQLRAMQEEKRLRHEEKQRKKQIKEQVQHQLYKQRNKQIFVEPEVREDSIIPQRRRLNLLKRYS